MLANLVQREVRPPVPRDRLCPAVGPRCVHVVGVDGHQRPAHPDAVCAREEPDAEKQEHVDAEHGGYGHRPTTPACATSGGVRPNWPGSRGALRNCRGGPADEANPGATGALIPDTCAYSPKAVLVRVSNRRVWSHARVCACLARIRCLPHRRRWLFARRRQRQNWTRADLNRVETRSLQCGQWFIQAIQHPPKTS